MTNTKQQHSNGSLGYANGFEYIVGPDDCLYRAPQHLPIDLQGFRQGARFECMPRANGFLTYLTEQGIFLTINA